MSVARSLERKERPDRPQAEPLLDSRPFFEEQNRGARHYQFNSLPEPTAIAGDPRLSPRPRVRIGSSASPPCTGLAAFDGLLPSVVLPIDGGATAS
jgi:hypothetical protein